ncbi:hypothetical protein P175DRAFT_0531800 [Aspergillus ochraceoroseus IBT 24754]|uniref:Uncharacterized protein n=1 Tax=Aspergillus ochraceoroseus IBT 24754 TaxID=1392256 RepID=A0A2T5LW08_9EURO|nr:uncharacterized protein P175DRAFT_0531800 [Aspergillus ochraceoroseus IBT 24754]PTU20465.1 hypothetical protein P175DRAFT_0531800 [Aspergillus ochraceoroseus IBT 24754]
MSHHFMKSVTAAILITVTPYIYTNLGIGDGVAILATVSIFGILGTEFTLSTVWKEYTPSSGARDLSFTPGNGLQARPLVEPQDPATFNVRLFCDPTMNGCNSAVLEANRAEGNCGICEL